MGGIVRGGRVDNEPGLVTEGAEGLGQKAKIPVPKKFIPGNGQIRVAENFHPGMGQPTLGKSWLGFLTADDIASGSDP